LPVVVAPLRDRIGNIPLLATHFLSDTARKLRRPVPALSPQQVEQLQRYPWPGNVRERENLKAAVGHTSGKIHGPRGAAELLGMKPTTLLSRLKALGLTRHGQDLR
jgi:DNA-binding NtrC family response regulator